MTKQAKVGGEFGANGEWYDGGKFINTIPENQKKEGSTKRKPRKVQVEPYKWVIDPEGRTPIFSIVGNVAQLTATGIQPFPPGVAYYGESLENVQAFCDRYNAGERWM